MIIIIAAIGIVSLVKIEWISEAVANVSMSFVAVVISLIGIGLTDKQIPSFKGEIKASNVDLKKTVIDEDHNYLVKFEITNLMSEPVVNFVYKVRYPSVIMFKSEKTNTQPTIIRSNKTRFLTEASFGILTGVSTQPENTVEVNFGIPLRVWKNTTGHIYFTITGDNIKPAVFVLNSSSRELLLNRKEVLLSPK